MSINQSKYSEGSFTSTLGSYINAGQSIDMAEPCMMCGVASNVCTICEYHI